MEPDRWFITRKEGLIVSHYSPETRQGLFETKDGLRVETLRGDSAQSPPLTDGQVLAVFQLAAKAEDLFQAPQDVEWTAAVRLTALQSRPITTLAEGDGDENAWYLTLTRSKENLQQLQRIIEDQVLPGMARDSSEMEAVDLDKLSPGATPGRGGPTQENPGSLDQGLLGLLYSLCTRDSAVRSGLQRPGSAGRPV